MLVLRNGEVHYPNRIVRLCDISIAPKEVVGLCGPSGCGKSTLAKVLASIQPLTHGSVSLPSRQKGEPNPVQWVAQQPEFAFNPYLTLRQSLQESWKNIDYSPLLDAFSICSSWLERKPNQLSGGQLQRLNLVRALVPTTQFLLCDEISAPLDLLTQKQLWQTLLHHCRMNEIGLLVMSHDSLLLEKICERVIDITQQK